MRAARFALIALFVAFGSAACARAGVDTDAGGDTGGPHDSGTGNDTGSHDSGNRDSGTGGRDVIFMFPDTGTGGGGTVPLYGMCTRSSDCAGTGSACLTAFPGAFCTQQCMTNTDCGSGVCVGAGGGAAGVCVPSCAGGGSGTATSGGCDPYGGMCVPGDNNNPPSIYACLPACFTSGAPSGFPSSCPGVEQCDAWTGACTTMLSTGADDGAACTADADCRGGRCVLPHDATTGAPTGFLGGYCLSFARYPGDSAYMVGAPIPQSDCPPGSAAVSVSASTGTGDSVPCFKTCSGGGCRAGYSCQPLGSGTMTTSNGVCLPIDCSTGGTCPSGTTCHTMSDGMGGTYGVCG